LFNVVKQLIIACVFVGSFLNSTAYAVIELAGALTQDETWVNADFHLVTGDIQIPDDITLTITSNALVQFSANSDFNNFAVDATLSELIVSGTVDIQGTSILPVTLTSNAFYCCDSKRNDI